MNMQNSNQNIQGQNDDQSTTQLGVRLTTREVTNVSSRPKTSNNQISKNIIQELPWDLDMMTRRFNLVTSVPWTSGAVSHTQLARLRVPQDLITTGISAAPCTLR